VVFAVEDGKTAAREVRDNTYTAHAQGQCQGEVEHSHDQPHSHAAIVGALHDCEVVLCGGMGWRAAEELKANGIQPIAVGQVELTAEQAAQALVDGKLRQVGPFCRCHEQLPDTQ
jgi:predicted Fe-Mo cluster-binding NifX family protein